MALGAAVVASCVAGSAFGQDYGNRYSRDRDPSGYDRTDDRGSWNSGEFWRGAPESPRQRIDWLQQRIQRGAADGSLDRREAYQLQRELNDIRRTTMRFRARSGGEWLPSDREMIQRRLDDLSRRIRWRRQNGEMGRSDWAAQSGRDPFVTDYDATRYYRDAPQYQERRLSAEDQVYRGSDGRYYCKRNDGTTGLIVGAVGGGVLGNVIDGGHNRAAGTLIGGALGALAGKSIDQNSDVRCR